MTASNASRAYGAANPGFTGTVTGAMGSDSFTVGGTTTAVLGSAVGPYPITPTVTGANLGNYSVTYVNGILTVGSGGADGDGEQRQPSLWSGEPSVYGDGDGSDGDGQLHGGGTTTAVLGSAVGPYPITPTVTGANLGNYSVTYVNGTLTVGQAALTVTASNASRAYGAANPAFTGTVTGAMGTDSFTVGGTTTAVLGSAVGPYPITPTVTGTNLGNYSVTYVNGILTVGQAALTVTAANASRAYGAANPAFTGTVTGAMGTDSFTVGGTTTAVLGSAVGPYPITPTVTGANLGNYSVTYVNGILTVGQAALTVTAANASRAYGAANPAFTGTVTGAMGSDSFTVGGTTTAVLGSAVGPYPITPTVTGANLGNYSVTYVNGILTVGQAALTVTAANASRAYGAANPGFTGTVTGAMGSDSFTVGGTTTAVLGSAVGPYPITPTVTGANLGNYSVTYVNGTLTVGQAALTVTASNASRAYGAANPGFTGTVTGAMGSDSFTVGGTTTAVLGSAVGPYPITPTVTGANLGNYSVTYVNGTLTVGQAALTVTAANASRAYGAANPGFTGTVTGAMGTDSFTVGGTTTAVLGSAVGPYPITPTVTGANLGNYSVTYVNGILTVGSGSADSDCGQRQPSLWSGEPRVYGDGDGSDGDGQLYGGGDDDGGPGISGGAVSHYPDGDGSEPGELQRDVCERDPYGGSGSPDSDCGQRQPGLWSGEPRVYGDGNGSDGVGQLHGGGDDDGGPGISGGAVSHYPDGDGSEPGELQRDVCERDPYGGSGSPDSDCGQRQPGLWSGEPWVYGDGDGSDGVGQLYGGGDDDGGPGISGGAVSHHPDGDGSEPGELQRDVCERDPYGRVRRP